MGMFEITALLLTLAAIFAYVNYRYIRLPTTIGVMVLALACSLVVIALGEFSAPVKQYAADVMLTIDFDEAVLHGMLSLLLFAGALHIDLSDLGRQKWAIGLLATVGVLLSTFIVGTASFYALRGIGLEITYLECLLLGALISPTDPIAVMGIMKRAGAPRDLETKVAGESLFNDGIGVVVFLALLGFVEHGQVTPGHIVKLVTMEALGGVVFGLAIGAFAYVLLRRVNQYQVEILITLALATGGYALAEQLHVSAPLAIVVAGLLIGNHGRAFAMSEETRRHLDTFWELVDDILNAVLFVLIGLEVLVMPINYLFLLAGAAVIPLTLAARWISVTSVIGALHYWRQFTPGTIAVLTWGGLRGGISVALALSLRGRQIEPSHVNVIIAVTYSVVIFSIVVQGLTIGRLVRLYRNQEPVESH